MNHTNNALHEYSDDEIHAALGSFISKWERKNSRLGNTDRISRE